MALGTIVLTLLVATGWRMKVEDWKEKDLGTNLYLSFILTFATGVTGVYANHTFKYARDYLDSLPKK